MKLEHLSTDEVFLTKGTPSHTYVSVSDGTYERGLKKAIQNKGTLCLITGPSKTGKTTLVSNVCTSLKLEKLIVACKVSLTADQLWRKALEKIKFERLTTTTRGKKASGELGFEVEGHLGWKWLAALTGKLTGKISRERSEEECRTQVLADPCAEHLIPALKYTNLFLIFEDFHYLTPAVQLEVSQEWKRFVDEQVSVAVISTTHHAYDLANANTDLTGRARHFVMTTWTQKDLAEIGKKGFAALNCALDQRTLDRIAEESVGLPLIAQAIYLEICSFRDIEETQLHKTNLILRTTEVHRILNNIALSDFGEFEKKYKRMARGLRAVKNRKYNTYEYLLMMFALGPIVYELNVVDIAERLDRLPIPSVAKPNQAQIRQALDGLNQLQGKISSSLLEWYEVDETVYILEPSFLFFLRWRKTGRRLPAIYEILSDFISGFQVTVEKGGQISVRITEELAGPENDSPAAEAKD